MIRTIAKWAPLGAALCMAAAAVILCRKARRDVQGIYRMLNQYD